MVDLRDIVEKDWPTVRQGLAGVLYVDNEPLPVAARDLGELATTKPAGRVATKLKWEGLDAEQFERLIYNLIGNAPGYENPLWGMKTLAPDGGRDLSVERVVQDPLSGTIRQRMIIQCRHWRDRSVSVPDIASLKEQMKLWEPPRVDVLVIATSGRFGKDAIKWVEAHNQSDSALRLDMWPESHLESLLALNPGLVAEFGLR